MNNYLIPANSKKSQLILNVFRPIDLSILIGGAVITLILLFLPGDSILWLVAKILPVGLALLLVMPMPYYHNVLVFLREAYIFVSSQRSYRWRGWCAAYEFDDKN
jgi:membrane protein implicated in regulation of membrane protease activity